MGRNLWVLSIGDNPTVHEPGEPEVKLIANIHGNEAIGRELLIRLGFLLCINYERDEMVKLLLTHTQVHLLPSMNPDGFELSIEGDVDGLVGRGNERSIDLNRDFPDQFSDSRSRSAQQPETVAVMNWTLSRPFVLSASLHAGALVAVYPYDGSLNRTSYYHASPDDVVFRQLALTYSQAHGQMHAGSIRCADDIFHEGITNGNAWYPLYGGMQDWNYLHSGCLELTLELGCVKYPRASSITDAWNDNKYALIVFIAQVHRTLRGFVLDAQTLSPIGSATIHVANNTHEITSTPDLGEYWRLLPSSGMFTVWASKPGYFPSTRVRINASELPYVRQTASEQLNFTLWRDHTSRWSRELDFDIILNRLPAYFTEADDVDKVIRTLVDGDFVTLIPLNAETVVVEIALVSKSFRRSSHAHSNATSRSIAPIPGRTRILIMAGMHEDDLVSVEMSVRLIRHYVKGTRLLDRRIGHLRSTQIVIIPYLSANNTNKAIRKFHSEFFEGVVHQTNRSCTTRQVSLVSDDIRRFIQTFRPHVLLTLEASDWENTQWSVRNHARSLPVKPIFLNRVNVSGFSMSELVDNLAMHYALGAGLLNLSSDDCTHSQNDVPRDHNAYRGDLHEDLGSTLATLSTAPHAIHPIGLAIRLICDPCHSSPLSPRILPELWHRTLSGLITLFSTIRNLSFYGQLLVETNRVLAAQSSMFSNLLDRQWVSSPSAQLLVQSASFFLSNHRSGDAITPPTSANATQWLSVEVDSETGLFCVLLPAGTYLVFASAAPPDTQLANEYEDMSLAISIRPDRSNGRTHIGLERQLAQIEFHGLEDMVKRLQKHGKSDLGNGRCGELRSIGHSRLGEPLYVFHMGLGITTLRTNVSSPFIDDADLLPLGSTHLNESDSLKSPSSRAVLFGNFHGHDRLTPQLLVHLVEWLCANRDRYGSVNAILSSVRLAIFPFPNPDGLSIAWRRSRDYETAMAEVSDTVDQSTVYCVNDSVVRHSDDQTRGGLLNFAGVDLWEDIITLTQNYANSTTHWWWEDETRANLSTKVEPETVALMRWLREYQPTAIFSFPTASIPQIGYGLDPSETQFAQNVSSEIYEWLHFLSRLLTPAFRRPPSMCSSIQAVAGARSHRPVRRPVVELINFTNMAALALSLASVSPELALIGTHDKQLLPSASFLPPLPLHSPTGLSFSLCPICSSPTSSGLARVWRDFRFPSLMLGLIGHATLSVPGSFGLIGEVVSQSGDPVSMARIHLDNMRSELVTNSMSTDTGKFRVALPPGVYRVSIRAQGYVDRNELVTIDAIKGPTFRVFHLTPLSVLDAGVRVQLTLIAGLLTGTFLCFGTLWLSYRFCCRPRSPYALSRRLTGTRSLKTHACDLEQNQSAYRLLPIGAETSSVSSIEVCDVTDELPDGTGESRLTHGPKVGFRKKNYSRLVNRYVLLPQEEDLVEVDLA